MHTLVSLRLLPSRTVYYDRTFQPETMNTNTLILGIPTSAKKYLDPLGWELRSPPHLSQKFTCPDNKT